MKIIKNENITPIDVDETLVCHDSSLCDEKIEIPDPLRERAIIVGIHAPMVRLLKEEKSRGSFVVVWSRGGYEWATAVVKALGLDKHVDLIMTKPRVYFDDKPVAEWLQDRVYLSPDTKYKTS